LGLILPAVREWFKDETGQTIALIKPQFEAGRKAAAVHAGVIKDDEVHQRVLVETLSAAMDIGFSPIDLIPSPILGPKGNVEFLVDLRLNGGNTEVDWEEMIDQALAKKPS
jgi:23S rRNA (cytidine1920-2'-O)/16S rRNA (cytidine1409-2'-O)-methyltransferase